MSNAYHLTLIYRALKMQTAAVEAFPVASPPARRHRLAMTKRPTRDEMRTDAARSRALQAWRRVDWTGLEKAWKPAALATAELVPNVLTHLRLEQRVAESQLLQLWQKIMDPVIAAHSRPVGLVRGTLFVEVDSSVWLSEIVRYRRAEIIERVQHAVGSEMVGKISFRTAG